MLLKARRSIFLALSALVMSMTVLVASPATANAFLVIPPAVIAAGFTEEGVAATAGGLALGGPPGWLAAGAVLAGGTLLYATQDTWLPWVTGLFSSGEPAPPSTTVVADYCTYSVAVDHTNAAGVVFSDTYVPGSKGSYCSMAGPSFQFEAQCITPDGNFLEKGGGGMSSWQAGIAQASIDNATICQHAGATAGDRPISIGWYSPADDPAHAWLTLAGTWKSPDSADQSLLEAHRQVTTDKICVDQYGAASDVTFTYVGIGGIPSGPCPAGTSPQAMKVTTGTEGGTQAPAFDISLDPTSPDAHAYTVCYANGASACKLALSMDGGLGCGIVGGVLSYAPCADWSKLDLSRSHCRYGPYDVALTMCDVLKEAFHTGYVTLNPARTDWIPANPNGTPWIAPVPNPTPGPTSTAVPTPTPSTEPDPTPQPTSSASPTSTGGPGPGVDPNPTATPTPTPTGTAVPDPTGTGVPDPTGTGAPNPTGTGVPNPTPTPTATPTPSPTPTATVPPLPGPGDKGAPGPGATPDESACWPSGWSALNPVEWVYMPVKCVVVWAFVPRAGAITDSFGGVKKAWTDSGPGKWVSYLGDAMSAGNVSGGGGCQGPALTIGATKFSPAETMHPLDACASPMSTIASIVKTVLTVGLWFGAFFVSARVILGALGVKVMDAFKGGDE